MPITNINNWVRLIPRPCSLDTWEIRYCLKRMLSTDAVTEEMVKFVKYRDISIDYQGLFLLGEFCDSTGIAPVFGVKKVGI